MIKVGFSLSFPVKIKCCPVMNIGNCCQNVIEQVGVPEELAFGGLSITGSIVDYKAYFVVDARRSFEKGVLEKIRQPNSSWFAGSKSVM